LAVVEAVSVVQAGLGVQVVVDRKVQMQAVREQAVKVMQVVQRLQVEAVVVVLVVLVLLLQA
jgi:hypothetical protein